MARNERPRTSFLNRLLHLFSRKGQDEFAAGVIEAKRLADHVKEKGVIGDWKVEKVIGAGANGLVALVVHRKTEQNAVMKLAMNLPSSGSLYWECDVLERIMQPNNNEDRTRHLVRLVDRGHTLNMDNQEVGYIVLESLPGNPVGLLGALSGDALISKVAEFGLQLLKALYDLHYLGFVHRDVKPENIGLYHDEVLVLYDLGLARFFTTKEGNVRGPRSNIVMCGTDEWASLNAELGRDQGRVDDLWGWFYVLIEWMNCTSKYPLCWSPFEDEADVRHFCKSSLFPAKYVLRNCPPEFYTIQSYLRCLSRDESPDYLYLARLLLQTKRRADGASIPVTPPAINEDDEKWERRIKCLEMLYN
ncbi:unnamed protein product [Anisakis simplex]|uniref:Protein kinase domain-containing protein n=1 Tax=Anisakis simplex TaxID=6269 RepID=A0A0M3K570_ANISI|nr:unnamed protein product [Anisakis simplex]